MSRIETKFKSLKAEGKKALIPYITAGDPEPAVTVDLMHAMVDAGADLIELGVPFSDPMADGPVIQAACERALAHGTSLTDVFGMVEAFRQKDSDTPVVLMGYLNPIEIMGYQTFAARASAAGVDGVLTVDMPPEEAGSVESVFEKAGLDPIFLASPTSNGERLQKIASVAKGFIYYVSLKGVTGAATLDVQAVANKVAGIRGFSDLPVGVGFGIRDARSAAAVARVGDAVVVGSAIVNRLAENASDKQAIIQSVTALLQDMRAAMDLVDSGVQE